MLSDIMPQLILLLVLLVFSSYFSICEISLTALSKIKLKVMLENNVKGAKKIEYVVKDTRKLFSTILVGSNITNILAPVVATSIAIEIGGNNTLTMVISTVIITSVVLIYCEMVPKMIAVQNPEKISLLVAGSVAFFMYVFTPFIYIFTLIAESTIKLFGISPNKADTFMTEEELKSIINLSHEEGVLRVDDKVMINNVFEFKEHNAKDVMIPRTDLVVIPSTASYNEVYDIFKKECYSRIPVYQDNIDNIIGILHFRDFIYSSSDSKLEDIIRIPFFTYELKSTKELFQEMKKNSIHIAVIIDEYGGTAGIVTLEDLIEEIVGDITDEYDEYDDKIKLIQENEYIVDGSTKIFYVNEMLSLKIISEKFDSIGGYVINILGYIPNSGQMVEYNGIKYIIEEVKKNKIEKLRIIIP